MSWKASTSSGNKIPQNKLLENNQFESKPFESKSFKDKPFENRADDPLFNRLSVGGLSLRNRVVMAPMTRECAPGGVPTRQMADYYRNRAAGGVGLIITEGAAPNSAGRFGAAVPCFYGTDALDGWRKVVDGVHAEGAAIMAQLWHVGAFTPSLIGMDDSLSEGVIRLSPSGLAAPDMPYGEAMSEAQIQQTIDDYARAAAAARQVGFDGVEIHGAHGYLPDQFFWSQTNRRTDTYGGPAIRERNRFSLELIDACRRSTAADFPISLRISQWKQLDYDAVLAKNPDQLAEWLQPLAEAGVDIFHCSTRRFWQPLFADSDLTFAGWTKKLTGKTVIAVGSVTLSNDFKSQQGKVSAGSVPEQIEQLNRCLESGDFDLIALGRALLANPDWCQLVARGEIDKLRPFAKTFLEQLI